MNDWYETLVGFLACCWYIYVLGYGIIMLFGARSILEVCGAIMATWILIVIPAIIRGKW
jgi:hypothetical protein